MERGSRTAMMVAAFRGRASARNDRVCHDPWALALAGPEGAEHADAYERSVPAIELWVALRTARLDEATEAAIAAGFRQVVVLGAGLDTRAARLARPQVRFFEVDAPPSQADKLARVRALDDYPVDAATYVSCDFERDDFLERLVVAGFDANAPAFFLWEGVTYYLTEAAVRATLSRIAEGASPRSKLAFDYFGKKFVTGEIKSEDDLAARDGVARLGEPLRFGMSDVLPVLYECGFRRVATESFDEIALRYLGTYDRARKFRFQSMAFASVAANVP